ncbi:MAG: NUDIX hydrolase [bacterium]
MTLATFLEALPKIKNLQLPGQEAQFKLSPPFRRQLIDKYKDAMKTAKKAAVVALIYPSLDNELKMLLILRKTYKGVHSNQIGFPGGKLEGDETMQEAALREVEEEVGVHQDSYMVVREMTEVYIPPSNFYVKPFLGFSERTLNFKKQDEEVEAIVEVPLDHLLDDSNMKPSVVPTSLEKQIEVPSFILNEHIVWGATAMMLSEIKDLLKESF